MPSVKVKFIEGSYTTVTNLVKDLVSSIVTTKIVDTKITSEVLTGAVSFEVNDVTSIAPGCILEIDPGTPISELVEVKEVDTETNIITLKDGTTFTNDHNAGARVVDTFWELAYPESIGAISDHAVIKHQVINGPTGYFEFKREPVVQVMSRYTNTEITKDNYFSITCKMGTNYDPLTNKWATDSDSIPARYSWFMSDTRSNVKEWLPVQYWISITPKRVSTVLSGDPSASFDDRLISWAYFGEIKSFEGALPDSQGNLAMVVSSDESPFVYLERNPVSAILSSPASAGTNTIEVSDTTNMYVGQNLIIADESATREIVTVDSISGTSVTLTKNLVYDHEISESVINEPLIHKYGDKTGTGVVDITMLKTASGFPFQAHYPSFTTPDEFVDKALEGPSAYTKKYHMSPIYVFHGYDSYRGELDGVAVTDRSSIVHLDDMIVDKDLPTEKVYKSFLVNAPYSIFNNASNSLYAIAILKYEA